jgi:hypothetical protein
MSKPYQIDGKEWRILKEDWDILIILDACRYDYFEKAYKDYLSEGELKKAISPSLKTLQWLNQVFTGYNKDLVYISGNPFINSIGEGGVKYEKFTGNEHFSKIVDAWDLGYDKDLKCVPPQKLTELFFDNYSEDKRFILHYIQPHAPYISDEYRKYLPHAMQKKGSGKAKRKTRGRIRGMRAFVTHNVIRIFGVGPIWKMMNYCIGIPVTLLNPTLERKIWKLSNSLLKWPNNQTAMIYMNEGWPGLRKAYKQNLDLVLKSVKEIVENTNAKILITADHGEFLGEYGLFGHSHAIRKPENTEVPWLETSGRSFAKKVIRKKEKIHESNSNSKKDEELIRRRLESLGYM